MSWAKSREEEELFFRKALIDKIYQSPEDGVILFDGHYLDSPVYFHGWPLSAEISNFERLAGNTIDVLCQRRGRTHFASRLVDGTVIEEQVELACSLEKYKVENVLKMLYDKS